MILGVIRTVQHWKLGAERAFKCRMFLNTWAVLALVTSNTGNLGI